VGRRRQLREAYGALGDARSWDEWAEAATALDALTGAEDWRAEEDSPLYDAAGVRDSLVRLRGLREAGDALGLARTLTDDLWRHLTDLAAPELYDVALGGTKRLVETFLEEADRSMRFLATHPVPGVPRSEVSRRFQDAFKVYGRTALLLSGGATLGFHHLGVVKALLDLDLLPRILSGASTGAMIAAGACARTDDELRAMFADLDCLRLDGLRPVGVRRAWETGAWLDPDQLTAVLRHNVGDWTFAEAFARSGRSLNISVSPTRVRQKPRLLCQLTAPDVLVASAALASSALPGLFPPVVLQEREGGRVVPYLPSERWVDGSIHGDLPTRRLSRLHNVNHFVVSQTNPHVLPLVRHHGRRGVSATVLAVASAGLRSQGTYAASVARRLTRGDRGAVGRLVDRLYNVVTQEYRGDIDLHPQFHLGLYRKVVSNPTRADLDRFVLEGQRSVWPRVSLIRAQTRLGRAFEDCLALLADPVG
jgi:TAG lipase/steryl ester hydrolase/phospholipase A2/LPA acyltransferase